VADPLEDTTVTLKRIAPGLVWLPRVLRERLTPAAAWTAIVLLATTAAILYSRASDIAKLKDGMDKIELQQERITTLLARLDQKADDMGKELDRQRQWREKIEEVAERERVPHRRRSP